MNTLFFITIILVLAWWTRNLHFRRLTTQYRFKLYALRDKLRMELINGKIDNNSETFNFLEYSVSKSIQYLDYLNIYTLLILSIKAHKDKNYIEFAKNISKKLSEDTILLNYYFELNQIIYEFLKKRFIISRSIVHILKMYLIGSIVIVQILTSYLENLAIMMKLIPEVKPAPVLLRSLLL